MLINFFPTSGDGSISKSSHTGLGSALFWINAICVAVYVVVFLVAYALGMVNDKDMRALDLDKNHEADAQSKYAGVAMAIRNALGHKPRPTDASKVAFAFRLWRHQACPPAKLRKNRKSAAKTSKRIPAEEYDLKVHSTYASVFREDKDGAPALQEPAACCSA